MPTDCRNADVLETSTPNTAWNQEQSESFTIAAQAQLCHWGKVPLAASWLGYPPLTLADKNISLVKRAARQLPPPPPLWLAGGVRGSRPSSLFL